MAEKIPSARATARATRRAGRREPEAGRAAAEKEDGQQVAPADPVGEPADRQREQAEGDEGAGREPDQLAVGQAALGRDARSPPSGR